MPFYDQGGYDVRLEWGFAGVERLSGEAAVAVIVDVLSFTTCVDVAVAHGAIVLPFPWKDERAAAFAAERNAILASDNRESGLSLSPVSLRGVIPGTRLVLPSPNGVSLSFASNAAVTVAACLRNAGAVSRWLAARSEPVAVFASGERWPDGSLRPAIDDLLCKTL